MPKKENTCRPLTWIDVDLKAIAFNLKAVRKLARNQKFSIPTRPAFCKGKPIFTDILTVIKANAYGHGMKEVAELLNKQSVGFFAVSDVCEGVQLRKMGMKQPILLFETTLASHAKLIVDYKLIPTICTLELAQALNHYARHKRKMIDVHVKIDTGMGRLGIWHEKAFDFIVKLYQLKNLRLTGIFTHFPAADTDKPFTKWQIKRLYELVLRLDKKGMVIPHVHAANSMGLAGYHTHVLNLARPGIMLYGLYPHESLKKKIKLKPAMSVKSQVIFLKDVEKHRSISYGRTFFTQKNMKVATVPIGYSDGYFRAFSNKSSVLVAGLRCPVIGVVTMDQIMIDVTRVKNPKVGMEVVILGRQGNNEITADELAKTAGTINYEIVCSFGSRLVKRHFS